MNNDIIKILKKKYIINNEICPRCYLLPDGSILHLDYNISHRDVAYYLADKKYDDIFDADEAMKYLSSLGFIRVNLQTEGFVMLNNIKPTEEQYDKLEELLDAYLGNIWKSSPYFRLIEPDLTYHNYNQHEIVSKDIIRLIKRYYINGILVEDKKC